MTHPADLDPELVAELEKAANALALRFARLNARATADAEDEDQDAAADDGGDDDEATNPDNEGGDELSDAPPMAADP